jgi:hypothetical protein
MGAVALTGLIVSLGPDGVRGIYSFLHRVVFGFQAIRAPARFGVLVGFALAVLAAVGLRELLSRVRAGHAQRLVASCCVALVAVEFVNVPLPTVPSPPLETPAARWLRDAPGAGAVLYLPLEKDLGNTRAMLDSLVHGRRIVNGYSGQRPAFFMGLADTLEKFPSADALWTLRDLGVRYVVSPARVPPATTSPSPLLERARFDGVVVYELAWSPEVEAALPRPDPPPPPAPGPPPFASHERAVYRVNWLTGAALGVSAGQATISGSRRAEQGSSAGLSPSGFRVALEVETADWVKNFFEARDQFVTDMDASFLPRRQAQQLREGRRHVDRETRYDAAARTMTVGEGPALPMPAGARDALAAFLYARTLPFADGYQTSFPVVEGGRQLTAKLRVTGRDRAAFQGALVDVWRVEARFESRAERRPIAATLLITRDARRVPVQIQVDAGFGSFRVELERYESR